MAMSARGAVTGSVDRDSSRAALSQDQRVQELCLLYAAVEAGDVAAIRTQALRLARELQQLSPLPAVDLVDEVLRLIWTPLTDGAQDPG